jgi:uncharacterized membrane protein
MLMAHRSASASVAAIATRLVVAVEKTVMIAAMAVAPISGFPLASAVGLSSADEFWVVPSIAIYAVVLVGWIGAFGIEMRLRSLARKAALKGAPLSNGYRRLFGTWRVLALLILAGMVALFVLMIWQPHQS